MAKYLILIHGIPNSVLLAFMFEVFVQRVLDKKLRT